MAKGGDATRAAFDAVALPHMDAVYSAGLHLTRNPDDAADLLQDTFLRAYRSWDQFTPGTNCKAWLVTILYNAFRNRYRAKRKEPVTVELVAETAADPNSAPSQQLLDPETLVASQVLDGEIDTALGELPEEFRAAVVLVDLHELTYEEAALALACPVGTIRSRLSRGRRLLQEALRGYAQARGIIPGIIR